MKYPIIIMLAFGLFGCRVEICEERAKIISVSKDVCGSFKGRVKVGDAYHAYAEYKVDEAIEKRKFGTKCEDTSTLKAKINELERALNDCQERLDGVSGIGCDVPQNMPPPAECDCEVIGKGWSK